MRNLKPLRGITEPQIQLHSDCYGWRLVGLPQVLDLLSRTTLPRPPSNRALHPGDAHRGKNPLFFFRFFFLPFCYVKVKQTLCFANSRICFSKSKKKMLSYLPNVHVLWWDHNLASKWHHKCTLPLGSGGCPTPPLWRDCTFFFFAPWRALDKVRCPQPHRCQLGSLFRGSPSCMAFSWPFTLYIYGLVPCLS